MPHTPMPTTTRARPATRRLGFETLNQDLRIDDLPVEGRLPDWLSGTLVRVTPARLDVGGRPLRHWFDGLAMLNAFSLTNGRVAYANCYLGTRAHAAAERGEFGMLGFAQDPCRAFYKRTATLFGANPNDNANVNLARLGERYLALTETPIPVEFDPDTLATLGARSWEDRIGGSLATAHPHFDPDGTMVSYVSHLSARSSYRVFTVAPGTARRSELARMPVREPAYMHSFAVTQRYVILAEFPLVVNPLRLAFSRKPLIHNYRWEPERGTRFLVFERATGKLTAAPQGPGIFAFHHVNAFERDRELVLDLVVHEPGPKAIEALEIERLRNVGEMVRPTRLWRFRVPLDGGQATGAPLTDEDVELPRINYAWANGRDYRFAYCCGAYSEESDWLDEVVKVDVDDGAISRWREAGCYPGEPVFAADPSARTEDEGVVLSVVLDADAGRSFLLCLDAGSFSERGRAEVPHHIPFGFHGQFFETA